MKFYLSRPDGSYSDYADYPEQPAARDDGEWVAGDPPEGTPLYVFVPLIDRLKAILFTLTDDVQAQFGGVAAAMDTALRNDKPAVAKLELMAITIPPELEPVRTSMLEEFDRV